MKSKDAQYKNKSVKDLESDAKNLRQEITKLNLEKSSNAQKDTNVIYKKRKSLAVALTFLNQKREVEKLQKEVKGGK